MSKKEDKYIKLMQENRSRILRIAFFYCDNPQDAKDLSQEIAYQVWKSFDSFRSESEMGTWLHRIALNTSIQFLRIIKRRPTKVSSSLIDLDVHPVAQNESIDLEIKELMRAIQNLKEIDKAIILLYLEEKSHSEIASIVNISVSNVGTRIQRIKKRLKKILMDQHYGH